MHNIGVAIEMNIPINRFPRTRAYNLSLNLFPLVYENDEYGDGSERSVDNALFD